ncbi:hypothetical protein [Homoserinibacter sp. GY 40078]|uniref:hypothetical protein n=1 Tax=Homoserinibacter sp. GY 40078 TaxID=2603275 RepID=UPI0011C9F0AB|nr:hypothetical protein [Homoserinibacter sp. GY 40078]TXK17708.1 hypothetical protein FVQ89_12970 [Homoserinibacter sp. GY 40078]
MAEMASTGDHARVVNTAGCRIRRLGTDAQGGRRPDPQDGRVILDATIAIDRLDDNVAGDALPAIALHYDCFLGDIRFEVGDLDFSTHCGWAPVLDFAICMAALLDGLEAGGDQVFEFTESDATIDMKRSDRIVELTASYSPGRISP